MGNDITIKTENVVSLVLENELSELIKPLEREIFLLRTFIAGTNYIENPEILEAIKEGDILPLRREPENKFDDKAILVLNQNGQKIGYVPEKENAVLSRLLDGGKKLNAKVKEINSSRTFRSIRIDIVMIDS